MILYLKLIMIMGCKNANRLLIVIVGIAFNGGAISKL